MSICEAPCPSLGKDRSRKNGRLVTCPSFCPEAVSYETDRYQKKYLNKNYDLAISNIF